MSNSARNGRQPPNPQGATETVHKLLRTIGLSGEIRQESHLRCALRYREEQGLNKVHVASIGNHRRPVHPRSGPDRATAPHLRVMPS